MLNVGVVSTGFVVNATFPLPLVAYEGPQLVPVESGIPAPGHDVHCALINGDRRCNTAIKMIILLILIAIVHILPSRSSRFNFPDTYTVYPSPYSEALLFSRLGPRLGATEAGGRPVTQTLATAWRRTANDRASESETIRVFLDQHPS